MLVSDLITSALRLIGVVAAGETPSTEELNDGLDAFNKMVAEWNTEHFSIYTIQNKQFNFSANVGTYVIGTGQTFDTERPVKIESAGVIQSNGLRSTLQILSSKQWAQIPEKNAVAVQPLYFYNDSDYPNSNLHVWPCPKCTTPTQIDLFMWQELTEPMALGDTLDTPPGYAKAMRFALAVDLAPEFGRPLDPSLVANAQQAKADLMGLNVSNAAAMEDPPVPGVAPGTPPAAQG